VPKDKIYTISVLTAFAVVAVAISLSSCAGITPPTPEEIVKHPLGTSTVKIGMTKEKVESLWGKPADTRIVEDTKRWAGPREMWVYEAQYSAIPLDAGYLSKTKKLYFDGDYLTTIDE